MIYSAFFFAVLLGFAPSEADAVADFLDDALFNLARIALLFLETPKEPMVRFPFLVFLSPLPIRTYSNVPAIIVKYQLITNNQLKK